MLSRTATLPLLNHPQVPVQMQIFHHPGEELEKVPEETVLQPQKEPRQPEISPVELMSPGNDSPGVELETVRELEMRVLVPSLRR